jgi:hypothetical protein
MKKLFLILAATTGFISAANAANLTVVNNTGTAVTVAHHNARGYQVIEAGQTRSVDLYGLMNYANNYDSQNDKKPTNAISSIVYGNGTVGFSGSYWDATNASIACTLNGSKIETTIKTGDKGQLCDENHPITLTMNK